MRCDDLSIWTRTSAHAGFTAGPDMIASAANASATSRPYRHFMIAPPPPDDPGA
jgi:hypothetical protein